MSPLRKAKNDEMPQRLKDIKVHKGMMINCLKLVIHCVSCPCAAK